MPSPAEPDPTACPTCARDSCDGECIVLTKIPPEACDRLKLPREVRGLGPARKCSIPRPCSSCRGETNLLYGTVALCQRCAITQMKRAS